MTGKEDARAFAGESTGSCAANSSAGSVDHGVLVLQQHVSVLFLDV